MAKSFNSEHGLVLFSKVKSNEDDLLIGGTVLIIVHNVTNQSGVIGAGSLDIFRDIVVLRSLKKMLLVKMNKMMSLNRSIALLLKTMK